MNHSFSRISFFSLLVWLMFTLFSLPVGAFNPPGSYGGAAITAGGQSLPIIGKAGTFYAGYTIALKSDGTIWAWGSNFTGQLGDSTTTDRYTPAQINDLSGVATIAAGKLPHTAAALKIDGTVWAWGENYWGQLGDGTKTARYRPVQVTGLTGVVALSAGESHTVALKSDGTVWAWGNDGSCQVGNGTCSYAQTAILTPILVTGLTGVTAIAAGEAHTVALKSDGTVWAWGYNYDGALGDGTTNPYNTLVQATGLTGVAAIAAGSHTVALKNDGTVWAWGGNYWGQLGDGTTTARYRPVQVASLTGVVAIAAAQSHTVALKSDGTIWTWGNNEKGQLGDGTTTNRATPVQVTGLNGVVAIAAAQSHTVALKSDGTIWTWGNNEKGQLGDGTTTNRATPVQVLGAGGNGFLNLQPITPPPNNISTSRAINITISTVSSGRYRLLGTLVDANGQPACGLALASGRCVFTCGPGSPRCEGGTDSLAFGQFDLTDLPTEANGTLNLQTFVSGSAPGLQVVKPDGSVQLVSGAASRANSHTLNTTITETGPGRYRLLGTLLDANNQPACGLVLASGRCMFSCGSGSPRCEGGTSSLAFGQFDLTDLLTEPNGTLNLQTFVAGSMPGLEVVQPPSGTCSYTLTPTRQTFDYPGGQGKVDVATQTGCTWTAQSQADWIMVTGGSSGTGSGTVTYNVSNNPGTQREGRVAIAGQTLTISQNASGGGGGDGGGH